jgi:rhodanese-related sulfurtransferase
MKKTMSLIMSVVLVAGLAVGCSSKKETGAAPASGTQQTQAAATKFKYYTADQVKEGIEKKSNMILLDIQVEDEYKAHHIKGVIPTYAYPVKTAEEQKKLDTALPKLEGTAPIVIVCPGGAGGAERTYDYLKTKGIKEDRLYILEKGQKGWPHADLLEK